jgi:hypothetical protein
VVVEAIVSLGVILAAAVSGLAAVLVSRRAGSSVDRKASGQIDTTDAGVLWVEARALRDDLSKRVDQLTAETNSLRTELRDASVMITKLLSQLELARAATELARAATEEAKAETIGLRDDIASVHQAVTTANAQSLAQLADNTESRRIAEIPLAERTATEREHIDTLGIQTGSH